MRAYIIVFVATQIVVVTEDNLAAMFTGSKDTLQTIKDENGVVKATFRWEAVTGVFETSPPNQGKDSNLVVPKFN